MGSIQLPTPGVPLPSVITRGPCKPVQSYVANNSVISFPRMIVDYPSPVPTTIYRILRVRRGGRVCLNRRDANSSFYEIQVCIHSISRNTPVFLLPVVEVRITNFTLPRSSRFDELINYKVFYD